MQQFWNGFEKRARPKWLKELARLGGDSQIAKHVHLNKYPEDLLKVVARDKVISPRSIKTILDGEKSNLINPFNKGNLRDGYFRKAEPEVSVPEIWRKGRYRKIPDVGYAAPLTRKKDDLFRPVQRLIGKKKGDVHVYHGTPKEKIDSILSEGLIPGGRLGSDGRPFPGAHAFVTPKEDFAQGYGRALFENDIPISKITHVGGYSGGLHELMTSEVTHGWKLKNVKE